jgi:glycosyltransferase involved in cell wall biosynthesis
MTAGAIIHVVQHLQPGGLEVLALELARAQRGASRNVLVASLEGSFPAASSAWPRLAPLADTLRFLGKRPGLDPALVWRLAALFRRERPACVHTHHAGPLLYAGIAARIARVPCLVHTEHDAWHLASPRRRRVVAAALALARPEIVADAPHVADAFAAAMGRPRPRVIPNGVDTDRFCPGNRADARAELGLPPDGPLIGVAARLQHVKGVDRAVRAMARLPEGVTLAVAGEGPLRRELEELAAAVAPGRVRFLGLVDGMERFYRAADVICLPSRDEGLPLSLLEAQSCGVPVAAFAVGGVPAAVDPASGRLVPAGDGAAMAEALAAMTAAPPATSPRGFVILNGSLRAAADSYLAISATEP